MGDGAPEAVLDTKDVLASAPLLASSSYAPRAGAAVADGRLAMVDGIAGKVIASVGLSESVTACMAASWRGGSSDLLLMERARSLLGSWDGIAIAAEGSGGVFLYDADARFVNRVMRAGGSGGMTAFACHDRYLAGVGVHQDGTRDPFLRVWDLRTMRELPATPLGLPVHERPTAVRWLTLGPMGQLVPTVLTSKGTMRCVQLDSLGAGPGAAFSPGVRVPLQDNARLLQKPGNGNVCASEHGTFLATIDSADMVTLQPLLPGQAMLASGTTQSQPLQRCSGDAQESPSSTSIGVSAMADALPADHALWAYGREPGARLLEPAACGRAMLSAHAPGRATPAWQDTMSLHLGKPAKQPTEEVLQAAGTVQGTAGAAVTIRAADLGLDVAAIRPNSTLYGRDEISRAVLAEHDPRLEQPGEESMSAGASALNSRVLQGRHRLPLYGVPLLPDAPTPELNAGMELRFDSDDSDADSRAEDEDAHAGGVSSPLASPHSACMQVPACSGFSASSSQLRSLKHAVALHAEGIRACAPAVLLLLRAWPELYQAVMLNPAAAIAPNTPARACWQGAQVALANMRATSALAPRERVVSTVYLERACALCTADDSVSATLSSVLDALRAGGKELGAETWASTAAVGTVHMRFFVDGSPLALHGNGDGVVRSASWGIPVQYPAKEGAPVPVGSRSKYAQDVSFKSLLRNSMSSTRRVRAFNPVAQEQQALVTLRTVGHQVPDLFWLNVAEGLRWQQELWHCADWVPYAVRLTHEPLDKWHKIGHVGCSTSAWAVEELMEVPEGDQSNVWVLVGCIAQHDGQGQRAAQYVTDLCLDSSGSLCGSFAGGRWWRWGNSGTMRSSFSAASSFMPGRRPCALLWQRAASAAAAADASQRLAPRLSAGHGAEASPERVVPLTPAADMLTSAHVPPMFLAHMLMPMPRRMRATYPLTVFNTPAVWQPPTDASQPAAAAYGDAPAQRIAALLDSSKVVAVDAEFVSTLRAVARILPGGKRQLLQPAVMCPARVTIVHMSGECVVDDWVAAPETEPVADYLTRWSGVRAGDLTPGVAKHPLFDVFTVQAKVQALLDAGAVFVGHGVDADFRGLGIHAPAGQIIDTVDLWRDLSATARPRALRHVASEVLGLHIQSGTHSSAEDAEATLALWKKYCEVAGTPQLAELLAVL